MVSLPHFAGQVALPISFNEAVPSQLLANSFKEKPDPANHIS